MSKGLVILAASVVLVTAVYAATSSTGGTKAMPMISGVTDQTATMPANASTVQQASPTAVASGSVQATVVDSPIKAGQHYSMTQLLQLGYAVEAKAFAEGEAVPGAVAKSAIWKIDGGVQEFWQGIVTSDGQFVLQKQLSGSKNSTVLNPDLTKNNN